VRPPVLTELLRRSDAWVELATGAAIITPARLGNHFRVTLTENARLEPPHEGHPGQRIVWRFQQDGTGSRTITVNSFFRQTGDLILDGTALAVTFWEALYDETTKEWAIHGVPDLSSLYDPAGTAAASMAAHLAATNPHPQYQLALVTAVTTTYTVLSTDYTVICTSAAPFVVTLLTAVGRAGQIFHIKNSGAGAVVIATTSAQTIDGYASGDISLAQYDNLTVQSNGTNWIIL